LKTVVEEIKRVSSDSGDIAERKDKEGFISGFTLTHAHAFLEPPGSKLTSDESGDEGSLPFERREKETRFSAAVAATVAREKLRKFGTAAAPKFDVAIVNGGAAWNKAKKRIEIRFRKNPKEEVPYNKIESNGFLPSVACIQEEVPETKMESFESRPSDSEHVRLRNDQILSDGGDGFSDGM
jgi:hypothetical protein